MTAISAGSETVGFNNQLPKTDLLFGGDVTIGDVAGVVSAVDTLEKEEADENDSQEPERDGPEDVEDSDLPDVVDDTDDDDIDFSQAGHATLPLLLTAAPFPFHLFSASAATTSASVNKLANNSFSRLSFLVGVAWGVEGEGDDRV